MSNGADPQKRCSKCGETKPVEMFSNHRKSLYCDVCQPEYNAPISKKLAKALAEFEAAQQVLTSGMKVCKKCGEKKPVSMFGGDGSQKDGLYPTCTVCISARYQVKNHTYFKQNDGAARRQKQSDLRISEQKEEELKQARLAKRCSTIQFEIETPRTPEQLEKEAEIRRIAREERNKKALEYLHPKTPEKRAKKREEKREYRERTREIMRQQAQAREEAKLISVSQEALRILELHGLDTPKIRKFSTAEEIREYRRYRYQLRKARIKANGGTHTRAEIRALLEAQNHQCAYCRRKVKLTEDHIIPLVQRGRNDIANICMACRRCNTQKSDRTPAQWIKRWYLVEPYNPDAP